MLKGLAEKSVDYRKKLEGIQIQIGKILVDLLKEFIPDIDFNLGGIGKAGEQTVFLISPSQFSSSRPLSSEKNNEDVSLYCILKDTFDKHNLSIDFDVDSIYISKHLAQAISEKLQELLSN